MVGRKPEKAPTNEEWLRDNPEAARDNYELGDLYGDSVERDVYSQQERHAEETPEIYSTDFDVNSALE